MDDRPVEQASPSDDDRPLVEYPVTERVRIVGAQPAAEAVAGSDPAEGLGADVTSAGPDAGDDAGHSGVGPEPPLASALEPRSPGPGTGPPDLPPWTDPPTGQVPAILDRGRNDPEDPWSAVLGGGPAWREHPHEWDEMVFEPSLLGDAHTRVGVLRDEPDDDAGWDLPVNDTGSDTGRATPAEAVEAASSDAGATRSADQPAPEASASAASVGASAASAGSGGRADAGAGKGRLSETSHAASGQHGRNVPAAIATGVGFAVVALACMHFGPLPTLVLVTAVVVLAAAEAYGALRSAGLRPATLLGLVATVAVMVAAYADGVGALALVSVVAVVGTMLWYLFRIGRGPAIQGMGATIVVFFWVGLLGSYGALLVTPTLFAHRHGIAFLFGAIAAVVGADVGALVVGKWLGRHHLAPTVSPNKTWEGVIGGAVVAVVLAVFLVGHVHPWTPGKAAVLGVVAAILAPLGDLCQSLVKRELGVKDMGSLLPGHGGLLDRFDALLFVLPATFYLVRAVHLG